VTPLKVIVVRTDDEMVWNRKWKAARLVYTARYRSLYRLWRREELSWKMSGRIVELWVWRRTKFQNQSSTGGSSGIGCLCELWGNFLCSDHHTRRDGLACD